MRLRRPYKLFSTRNALGCIAMAMFDHVQIKVRDFQKSRAFYTAVLGTLGYGTVLEFNVCIGFGISPHDMFEVRQADADAPLSASVHIAFAAGSQDAVRAFHATALAHGARENGTPGYRPEYEDGYFAAFVIDPDGHNLEAVYKER
jgi:catechol 2,3-dioxygenase-like lactoylglutathione lyase family enzyme